MAGHNDQIGQVTRSSVGNICYRFIARNAVKETWTSEAEQQWSSGGRNGTPTLRLRGGNDDIIFVTL